MLKRVFSSLARAQYSLTLRANPLFRFSDRRDLSNGNEDDDFEFDFGKPTETRSKQSTPAYRRQQYDNNDSGRPFRGNRTFAPQTSELLKTQSLSDLLNAIEQQTAFNSKYESVKLLLHTLQLFRKSPPRLLTQFKRSKAAEALYDDVMRNMVQTDKPYVWVIAYNFYAQLKGNYQINWALDRATLTQLFSRIEQAVEDGTLSEQDLIKVLKSSLALGHSVAGSAMKKSSIKLLEVNGPLTSEQVSYLAYLIGNFSFTSDYTAWVRKLVENKSVLMEGANLPAQVDVYVALKRARDHSELIELQKEIEGQIMTTIAAEDVRCKSSIFKILNSVPNSKLKRVRPQLITKLVSIVRSQPESLTYYDFVDICEYISRNSDSSANVELIKALSELSAASPNIVVSKINAVTDPRVIAACRESRNTHEVRKAFGSAILANIDECLTSSRSFNFSMLNFVSRDDLQAVVDKLPSRSKIMNNFDLKCILLLAKIRNINAPESLTETVDSALESLGIINSVMTKMVTTNSEVGAAMVKKLAASNLTYRDRLNLAYVSPDNAVEVLEPMSGKTQLLKIVDTDANLLLNSRSLQLLADELANNIKKSASFVTLTRLDRLLNHNSSVSRMRYERPHDFARMLTGILTQHAVDATVASRYSPQSLLNVVSQSIDDELLNHYSTRPVQELVGAFLALTATSTNVNNYDVARRLANLLHSAPEAANAGYIELLFADGSAGKRNTDARVVEHAFPSQSAYVTAGKLSELDATYNRVYESIDSEKLGYNNLRLVLKLLNKSDAELLEKINDANLDKVIDGDNAQQFVLIALKRYLLTRETAVLEKIIERVERLEDVKPMRSTILRIYSLANSELKTVSESPALRRLLDNMIEKVNMSRYARTSSKNMDTLINYKIANDKSIDDLVNDTKLPRDVKSLIFSRLIHHDKQPELVSKMLSDVPADAIKRVINELHKLVQVVMLSPHSEQDADRVYRAIEGLKSLKPINMTLANRYALLWLGVRRPELVEKLIGEVSPRQLQMRNHAAELVVNVLRKSGAEVSEPPVFSGMKAAEAVVGDKVLIADTLSSPVKDSVLKDLFPGKTIVEIKVADIKSAVTVEQLEKILTDSGLLTGELTAEQRAEAETLLTNFKNKPAYAQNKRKDSISDSNNDSNPNPKTSSSSSSDDDSSSSSSDSDNDKDHK